MITITIRGTVKFTTTQGELTIPYGQADSSIIGKSDKVYLDYNGTLSGSCLAGYSTSGVPMGTTTGNKVTSMSIDLDNGGLINYNNPPTVSASTNFYYGGTRYMPTTSVSGSDAQISILLVVDDVQNNRAFVSLNLTEYPNASIVALRTAFATYASNTILPNGYPYNGYGTLSIDHDIFDIYREYNVLPTISYITQAAVTATYNFFNGLSPLPDGYNVTYDLVDCTGDAENPIVIPPNATITNFDFSPDTDYSFVFNSVYIDGDGFPSGTPIIYDWNPDTGHLKIGPITSSITVHVHAYTDPYSDLPVDGETDIPNSDIIGVPSLPTLGAVSAGIIGLFAPSPSQMQALASYMWTDFGGTGTTVEDILGEIVEALKRVIANPLDYVIGLNIIPSQGLSIGSDRQIRFGFVQSGVSMPQLTSEYFVVDCGTLRFDTLCGDTFLDYAPYSKFSIYLPYVGIKEVDANDFVGHTIGVVYHGDVVTGGITAYITKDGSVMYQYSGCCALNVPLSSDGWGSTIAGAVQIATSLVTGGFAGGAAGVAESAVKGAASVASNPSLLSPKVAHSGAVSGGAGCMGVQTPFVIREAVRFHSTVGMNTVSGYPSFYFKSLGAVSGYTVVLDVHLKGIPATSEEIREIEDLLKGGVVL